MIPKLGNETVRIPALAVTILTLVVSVGGAMADVFSTGEASIAAIVAAISTLLSGELGRSQTNSPATEQKNMTEAMMWGAAVAERETLGRLAPDAVSEFGTPEVDPSFTFDTAEG